MSSPIHESVVRSLMEPLTHAIGRLRELGWETGPNSVSQLEGGIFTELTTSKSMFIVDVTVHNLFDDAFVIFEVAHMRSRSDALAKISKRLANNRKLLKAGLINILESPKFENPTCDSTKDDAFDIPS